MRDLKLKWIQEDSTDKEQTQMQTSLSETSTNSSINELVIPDPTSFLQSKSDPTLVGKDFEFYSGPTIINFDVFRSMIPGISIPDLNTFDFLRHENYELDEHFGLMPKLNASILLMLSKYLCPKNILMIGTGRGLVDVFLAQTLAKGGRLDTVDPGFIRVKQSLTRIPVNSFNQRYIRYKDSEVGEYITLAKNQRIISSDSICQFFVDSVEFFEERVQRILHATPSEAEELKYDLIVVDGNHTYPQPEVDINYSLGFLRKGGVLFVDDWLKLHSNSGITFAGLKICHELRNYLYHVSSVSEASEWQTTCVFMINASRAERPPIRGSASFTLQNSVAFRSWQFGR